MPENKKHKITCQACGGHRADKERTCLDCGSYIPKKRRIKNV